MKLIQHTTKLLAAGPLLLGSCLFAQTVVVQWGSDDDIVTGFFNGNRDSISVDLSSTINPTSGSQGYYQGDLTPTGRSAVFYGTVYNSTDGNSRLQIPNSITPNPLTFDGSNGTDTTAGRTFAGTAIWQKSDGFLTGSDTITWSDIDTIKWDTNVNASTSRGETRFVVRNGASDFYVSNDLGVFTSASAGTATKSDATSWFDYDPTTDITNIGSAATPTLTDITAIGYLFTKVDDFTSISNRTSEFSVTTAIPEPNTFALLSGVLALSAVVIRRRRA